MFPSVGGGGGSGFGVAGFDAGSEGRTAAEDADFFLGRLFTASTGLGAPTPRMIRFCSSSSHQVRAREARTKGRVFLFLQSSIRSRCSRRASLSGPSNRFGGFVPFIGERPSDMWAIIMLKLG